MPYYEVIYETGAKAVVCAESEEEVLGAVEEQHRRARMGEVGGPSGHRAERVAKVLEYDKHPADYNLDQTVSTDVAEKSISEALKAISNDESHTPKGVIDVPELAAAVRDISSPLVTNPGPHDSAYKMQEKRELDSSLWGGDN